MRRCLLHIGVHKTGTTAIQHTLADHAPELEQRGICYPTTGRANGRSHNQIALELAASDRALDREANASLLEAALRRTDCDFLVMSAEEFSSPRIRPDLLSAWLGKIRTGGWDITALAYIRPQTALANSGYAQDVKTFHQSANFDDFLACFDQLGKPGYTEKFQVWAAMPNVRLVFVPYTAATTGPQIAARMLVAGGIPEDRLAGLTLEARMVNETPGSMAIAALRWVLMTDPRVKERGGAGGRLSMFAREEAERRGWSGDRFVGLDNERAGRLWDRWAERNAAFAAQHLGRSWNEVFAEERTRDWKRNEVELPSLSDERRSEFDDFARTVLAAADGFAERDRKRKEREERAAAGERKPVNSARSAQA